MTNGARPLAPAGGQSSQVGTLLDRAVVPVTDELADPEPPADVLPPVPAEFDPPPPLEVDPVAEPPDVVPVAAAVVVFAVVVVAGKVTAP